MWPGSPLELLREKSAVSIFDRMTSHWTSTQHLTDDVLAEIWTAAVAEGRAASHPHLNVCAECRYRYTDFTRFLDEIKEDAYAEADQVMSPERLGAQQAQIFRRLEALERPARVIAFPKANRPAISPSRVGQRWVATAAAAGLVIGVVAGQLVPFRRALAPAERPAGAVVADSAPARTGNVTPVSNIGPVDEAFIDGDTELSARSMRDSSLRALDDFTPRARDFDR
jgi:hypothetical protein